MSQADPLTYEKILKLFKKTDRKFQETDRKMKENAAQMKESAARVDEALEKSAKQLERTQKEVGSLSSTVGRLVADLVAGDIVDQFRELGYKISSLSYEKKFGEPNSGNVGEIDLLLEDGGIDILIEVKTNLKIDDVRDHIERLAKYRRHTDSTGRGEKHRYIGAVAGTVVEPHVVDFAHENGLYVIVQSARATKILPRPDNFVAKKW